MVVDGLIDFGAGGFEIVAQDGAAHQVQAVATGAEAPACRALGLAAPCLPLRMGHLAHGRLLTVREFTASLRGELTVEVPPRATLMVTDVDPSGAESSAGWAADLALSFAVAWAVAVCCVFLWLIYRRWAGSARRRWVRLLRRLERTVMSADPVLSQVLTPALTSMVRALRDRRLDADSVEGRRLEQSLRQLHSELLSGILEKRRIDRRQVADELAGQLQLAVEAAAEASRAR